MNFIGKEKISRHTTPLVQLSILLFLISLCSCKNATFLHRKYTKGVYYNSIAKDKTVKENKTILASKTNFIAVPLKEIICDLGLMEARQKPVQSDLLKSKVVLYNKTVENNQNFKSFEKYNGFPRMSRDARISCNLGSLAAPLALIGVFYAVLGFPFVIILVLEVIAVVFALIAIRAGLRGMSDGLLSGYGSVLGILFGLVTLLFIGFNFHLLYGA